MTKAELLDTVAKKAGTTKVDTEKVLDSFFEHVKSCLKRGEQVTWSGFGKFHTTKRAARTVANPQDRTKTVKVPASTAAKFTPSSTLKSELNQKKK